MMQVVLTGAGLVHAAAGDFVPSCIAKECSLQAKALGGDGYVKALHSCASKGFGPCGDEAWACLGDPACRSVLSCGPQVLDSCGSDLWKMLTDPHEREKFACVSTCTHNHTVDPFCVAVKCGKAVIGCIEDEACRKSVECIPKVLKSCSGAAFGCLFGKDPVCRQNLQCLGHGLEGCAGPASNALTDSRVADFIDCAGDKCPHPGVVPETLTQAIAVPATAPKNPASQMVCIAEKCGKEVLTVLEDQDVKNLLHCTAGANLTGLCSSVGSCLEDEKCNEAVKCWAAPLKVCRNDLWHMVTDPATRKRLESNVQCLEGCGQANKGEIVDGAFCVLDKCAKDLLDCRKDDACWGSVQCLPNAMKTCTMPMLDAYVHQELFSNSVKCLGRGLESCGRGAVEMLRNKDVANAVRCAAQCTRPPSSNVDVMI